MSTLIPDSILARLEADNAPYIGGRFLTDTSVGTMQHVDPSTGRSIAVAAIGGAAEIDAAVRSSQVAQRHWMSLPSSRRAAILQRFADLIERDADLLCDVLAVDAGVPASMGVALAVAWVRHFAGWADKVTGVAGDATASGGLYYTRREPYGVVGVVIPWNHPIIATCQVALPAIAAGNAVVLKPPSVTPFAALQLGRLAIEAGMPEGLLNIVPGDAEAGEALIRHPGVGKISFTGGVGTARQVMATAADVLKPVFLELGGKSPNLLFAGCRAAGPGAVFAVLCDGAFGAGLRAAHAPAGRKLRLRPGRRNARRDGRALQDRPGARSCHDVRPRRQRSGMPEDSRRHRPRGGRAAGPAGGRRQTCWRRACRRLLHRADDLCRRRSAQPHRARGNLRGPCCR